MVRGTSISIVGANRSSSKYWLTKQAIATIVMLSVFRRVSHCAGEMFSNIFPAHRNLATFMLPIAAGLGVAAVSVGADRLGRKPMLLFHAVGWLCR